MKNEFKNFDQLAEAFKSVAEAQNACLKQCKTMLAGFKALGERDIKYMDGYMDGLWNFIEAGGETEKLYRDYLAYISEFNPKEAQRRFKSLEDDLGYWTPVVIAAASVAKELHQGQKDKGGNDYFTSHLLPVGNSGFDWKEKVVGFLHDAAEDTDYSVENVVNAVRKKLDTLADSKSDDWWVEFDIMPYPNGSIFFPSDDDWAEIASALHILNHHNAPNRTAYIQKNKQNMLPLRVKLNDLRNNLDISRIPQPTSKDLDRIERYKAEYGELLNAFYELINKEQEENV